MIELLSSLPKYKIARTFHRQPPLPISYTLGLTYKCQARCHTCRIYEHPPVDEMKPEEWKRVFGSIGRSPYWVTFTGGEPFLYTDLCEVYWLLSSICCPRIVSIPTNGQMTDRITDWVWDIAKIAPGIALVVNVSLDHYLDSENDKIRGLSGYTANALSTIKNLNKMASSVSNLEVGIHTVISKFNVEQFREIYEQLSKVVLKPENYITEVAENRVELGTMLLDIAPREKEYREAIQDMIGNKGHGVKQALRKEYYQNVSRWLEDRDHMPACYAGYASCQITPDGEVWACCIKAESMGNLRENDYQFKKIWHSEEAKKVRQGARKCSCPMANVNYTNCLMDMPSLFRIARRLV